MQTIQSKVTDQQLEEIKELVKQGIYPSKSEVVREGVRTVLENKNLKK